MFEKSTHFDTQCLELQLILFFSSIFQGTTNCRARVITQKHMYGEEIVNQSFEHNHPCPKIKKMYRGKTTLPILPDLTDLPKLELIKTDLK